MDAIAQHPYGDVQMQMLNKEIALNRRTFIGEIFFISSCTFIDLSLNLAMSPLLAKCNSRNLIILIIIICIVFC
jgi:hypothetical protein